MAEKSKKEFIKDKLERIKKDYKKFKPIVKKAGYDLDDQAEKYSLLYIKLNNGIKHEIKYKEHQGVIKPIILTAYNHKQVEEIKEWFLEKKLDRPEKAFDFNKCATTYFTTIENWLDLAKQLEEVETIVRRGINEDGLFTNIVKCWRTMFETGMTAMIDRRSSLFDRIDHRITLNKPLTKDSYREHVVPIIFLVNEAIKMFKEGATDAEIANMLQQNLFVYHITKDQAKHLDNELGLKTTMPKGWKFGDSVFARLDAAGIKDAGALQRAMCLIRMEL